MKKYRHTHRSVILFLLLSPLTLFIYPLVLLTHLGKEVNRMNEGKEGYRKSMNYVGVFFLGFITFFIVPIVWFCRVSRKLGEKGTELGIKKPHTSAISFFLLVFLFGAFIITALIGLAKFFHTANAVERKLNALMEEEAAKAAEEEILPEATSIAEEAAPVIESESAEEPQPEEEAEEAAEEEPEEEPAPFDYVTETPQDISDPNTPRSEIAAIYHVAARTDTRKWQVRVPNSDIPPKLFDSQEEAVAYAKGLAARRHATVRLKKKNG